MLCSFHVSCLCSFLSPLTSCSSADCFFCPVIVLYFILSKSHIGFNVGFQLQKDIIGNGTNPDSHFLLFFLLFFFWQSLLLFILTRYCWIDPECTCVTRWQGVLTAMKTNHDGSSKHTMHSSAFTLALATQLFGTFSFTSENTSNMLICHLIWLPPRTYPFEN